MCPSRRLCALLFAALCPASLLAGEVAPPPAMTAPASAGDSPPVVTATPATASSPAAVTVPALPPVPAAPAASPALALTPPLVRVLPAERMVSPRVAELLAAATPKFTAVPAPPATLPLPPADTLTPGDIIKLAPVLVESSRLRLPDEVQSLSADGLAAELQKRYPGASTKGQDPYQIGHGRPNYARLMYEGDRNLKEKTSLENLADLMDRTGDSSAGERLKREIQGAFGGGYKDPLAEAMEKSVNGGRR